MFRNHFISIVRSLKRNKVYAAINISGLAIGFASALLIGIYVNHEFTYDKHYSDHERIYRLSARNFAFSSVAHLNLLSEKVAGIEATVMVQPLSSATLKFEDKSFIEDSFFLATGGYLKVFDQQFIYGNPETAFDAPNAMVLTASISEKVFGTKNPIGETVALSTSEEPDSYVVTGVIEDLPVNSSLRFTGIARASEAFIEANRDNFNMTIGYSYFKTETPIASEIMQNRSDKVFARRRFEQGVKETDFEKFAEANKKNQPLVLKLADVHLKSNLPFEASSPGNRQYLFIFIGIAVFIIVLAAINYVNLATAEASKRAKEVGVRKVLGTVRRELIGRFLGESFLLTLSASLIALGLAEGALQLISGMGFVSFDVNVFDFPTLIVLIVLVASLTGLLAGIYPAFYLTSFNPSAVLKGDYGIGAKSKTFRSALVVFQFVVSLSLAIFSVFAYQQLNYGLNKDLGFTKEGVIVVDNSKSQLGDRIEAFRNEILQLPAVENISFNRFSMIDNLSLLGMSEIGGEGTFHRIQYKLVDAAFVPTMGMSIADGRNFDEAIDANNAAILVNETFAKALGDELYEKRFNAGFRGENAKIVGVVKDFHSANFNEAIGPTVFFNSEVERQFNIKLQNINDPSALRQIEEVYGKFTDEPLDYYFFDQKFNQLFNAEKRMSQIVTTFTGLSLFVALLGLIGLISYKLDQRIKEIGIRKVLGASVSQILSLLSREVIVLVAVALLITIPISYYAVSGWMNDFAYHIELSVLPFAGVAVIAIVSILAIVTIRSYRTATANPINALRNQ
ncbi:ABC transporter permease [Roseivirga sp. E12]|uniref:ABC transporter permease n=1 Tax=Roseivirga sp. E12 TaxID=2819237 RepID=UPI001ABD0025|nr:ABC transporter permease [Roseivirga sp. E12]MBO3700660.1 ABC transporter permease [Roseivirga sp. E12]